MLFLLHECEYHQGHSPVEGCCHDHSDLPSAIQRIHENAAKCEADDVAQISIRRPDPHRLTFSLQVEMFVGEG